MGDPIQKWWRELDARERSEIAWAYLYQSHWSHGTSGHLANTVIAKLAKVVGLDAILQEYIHNTINGTKADPQ